MRVAGTGVIISAAGLLVASVTSAGAQTTCQPTITQPCATPPRSDTAASRSVDSNRSDQARRSRRGLSVGSDATLGLTPGARGLGLQQRF
jgi:hypothetical protein